MARVRERMNLIERTQDTILKIHSFVLKKPRYYKNVYNTSTTELLLNKENVIRNMCTCTAPSHKYSRKQDGGRKRI